MWGFSSFPEVLCQLPNLEELRMVNQQLLRIPTSLSGLKKLAILHL